MNLLQALLSIGLSEGNNLGPSWLYAEGSAHMVDIFCLHFQRLFTCSIEKMLRCCTVFLSLSGYNSLAPEVPGARALFSFASIVL